MKKRCLRGGGSRSAPAPLEAAKDGGEDGEGKGKAKTENVKRKGEVRENGKQIASLVEFLDKLCPDAKKGKPCAYGVERRAPCDKSEFDWDGVLKNKKPRATAKRGDGQGAEEEGLDGELRLANWLAALVAGAARDESAIPFAFGPSWLGVAGVAMNHGDAAAGFEGGKVEQKRDGPKTIRRLGGLPKSWW